MYRIATDRAEGVAEELTLSLKPALAAQDHWRKITAPHRVARVRAVARFEDGKHLDAQ